MVYLQKNYANRKPFGYLPAHRAGNSFFKMISMLSCKTCKTCTKFKKKHEFQSSDGEVAMCTQKRVNKNKTKNGCSKSKSSKFLLNVLLN